MENLTSDKLVEIIDLLEQEQDEQQGALWFDLDEKIETLNNYDTAINALKQIAFTQFELEL